ncbi:MAG: folylpolyglutamate synthase/dihydrofolate synthase family protein [Clostridia bacterium]|nr:folylpolyglutamate synthase/dihydrofolate synthase family protein [Clostridia bacterium]
MCGKVEENVVDFILSLPKISYPLGNANLKKLLNALGNPQKSLKFVHIAGTNGKGSCAVMTGSILREAGYKTGVFTSPYLVDFCERIKIGEENIPYAKLRFYTETVQNKITELKISLSQFAFILAVALLYYKEEGCGIVMLEVGLGGRLDATNVIEKSEVSVIMSIGLDHTELLGDTKEKIAFEKAGIIKQNGDVVLLKQEKSVEAVVRAECEKKTARLYVSNPDKTGYKLGLLGEFQKENASVVLEVIRLLKEKGYEITDENIKNGLLNAKHLGRFQRVRENVLIDSAHNPDGITALIKALPEEYKKTAVIAMMQDKAIDDVLEILKDEFQKFIVTEIDMPRCEKAEVISEKLIKMGKSVKTVSDLKTALTMAENEEFSVILGSVYLAGEAIKRYSQ